MDDWYSNERHSGVSLRAYPDGVFVSGWYDGFVGIEGNFISWDDLDELRKKAKRRNPFRPVEAKP